MNRLESFPPAGSGRAHIAPQELSGVMSRLPHAGASSGGTSAQHASHWTGRNSTNAPVVPVEIFYHICENLPQNSLATVARANTSLAQVSERYMYRRLQLTTIPQALQCFQTLSAKASAAQSVREFIIMISDASRCATEFGPRLATTLKTLTHLSALHLAIEGPYAPVLHECFFPNLVTFSSIVDLSPNWGPVADFLNRHPSISEVCMGGESPGQRFVLAADALPNLRAYMGSRRLAPIFVPGRPVNRVTLAWHAPNIELEVDCIIPRLAQSSSPITSFSCATFGWSSALIRSVAENLPKLRSIRFHNISADYYNEAELITTLSDVLAAFPELARLELPCRGPLRTILTSKDESEGTKAWKTLAPRLSTIVFPSGRMWLCSSDGSWSQHH